jgi:hypothetical protein
MTYEIYDNFLDPGTFANLQSIMLGESFPWYYNDYIVRKGDSVEEPSMNIYNLQFTHIFYQNHKPRSPHFDLMLPIIEKINPYALIRIKANFGPSTPERVVSGFHVDYPSDAPNLKTAVFYLNDNNGGTLFKGGEEVASFENRLVVFDNNMLHSGVSCTDTKFRSLINFCYFEQ